jgi:hypothetical protein
MRTLFVPVVLLGLVSCTAPPWTVPPPAPGRLTLSNFNYDHARIETFVTPFPDCGLRAGMVTSSFELPLNGTRVVDTPPDSDVCWRRIEPPLAETRPPGAVVPAVPWNRAYTTSGRIVDSQL